ncbi:RNA polymerase sigma-54 factor [Clostridium botulinum C str. Eklund]|nr:RNA polymerase sigma-54 factor [Clostridium botulinum C str. Eklund]NEZ49487.1 RNA polymerase factor sigma-54 [Clostridium botulinum]
MKMNFNLELVQQQKLIMTQQMQLSIKLLQMSNLEIQKYMEKEIQENPVLDVEGKKEFIEKEKDFKEYRKFLKHLEFDDYNNNNYSKDKEYVSPLNFIGAKKSLKEYLKEQILVQNNKKSIKKACEYIVENIDERGYLNVDLVDVEKEINISKKCAEEALKIVQSLEPYGVGARDLKECLKIQLNIKKIYNEDIIKIIDNYLPLIADNKYNVIAKKLNITVKLAQSCGDIIKSLEPKPSRGFFTGEETNYIVPEAYIKKINNKYYVIMNNENIPTLNINKVYKQMFNENENKEVKEFIKDKLDRAMFLIKSINQRESTIYNILTKIVEIQEEYFEYGRESLKPMTLKEVADELSIHESTVSRAIKDKYIHTQHGTIKIKNLFTTKILRMDSFDDMSTITVKSNIKKLIQEENKNKPLSDQKICDFLQNKGVNISRRTVAKYREEARIPSSSKRKRF